MIQQRRYSCTFVVALSQTVSDSRSLAVGPAAAQPEEGAAAADEAEAKGASTGACTQCEVVVAVKAWPENSRDRNWRMAWRANAAR